MVIDQRARWVRDAYGGASVEWFLIVTVVTILVTRVYLEITGFPRIGGGGLHIAHALLGGMLMMTALVAGWMFLGVGTRVACVIVGGIGFGLFLDEVGKFVTATNDYFFGASAEIMYMIIVVVLIANRSARLIRTPSGVECLANAAAIASRGIVHGLPDYRREWALRLLQRAELAGSVSPTVVVHVRSVLDDCPNRPGSRLTPADVVPATVKKFFGRRWWIHVLGWGMLLSAFFNVAWGIVTLVWGGVNLWPDEPGMTIESMSVSGAVSFVSACIVVTVAGPALFALHRTGGAGPILWLRIAALSFTMLNAIANFATIGFWALVNLSIGAFAMAVLGHHIAMVRAQPPVAPARCSTSDRS